MTSELNYRSAKSPSKALREIKRCSGAQFDPDVVEAFVNAYEKNESSWPISLCSQHS